MPAEDAPQNIYDDPAFFAGYATLERFGAGWERAVEQPDFLALLPDVRGRRVLDLGCGAGQLARFLAEQGAAAVVGVDVSERMLGLARADRAHPRVTYRRESMEGLSFPAASFDLVVSSLAFHYVRDYRELVGRIAGWLAPGGASSSRPSTPSTPPAGWASPATPGSRAPAGPVWPGRSTATRTRAGRETRWFVSGVVRYHRTFATLVNGLLEAGLTLQRVVEPVPERRLAARAPGVGGRAAPSDVRPVPRGAGLSRPAGRAQSARGSSGRGTVRPSAAAR